MINHAVLNNGKISFNMDGIEDADKVLAGIGPHANSVTAMELRHICGSSAARKITTFIGAAPC